FYSGRRGKRAARFPEASAMKVVITGASGQIGTNLGLHLLSLGHAVLGIDKRANAWTQSFRTIIADLTAPPDAGGNAALPREALDFAPEAVVHLAAWAKVHQLVKEPAKAFENVAMTFAALELARRSKAPVLFGSSREVYGDVLRHVTEESMADFVIAESPYSASKIAGEAFFSSYAKCYGLKTLVFRFSNVYGRFDNDLDRMERVIPLFVRRIWRGEPITVFGRNKMLDFTYVDDCVAGIAAGIERLTGGAAGVAGQTINLAYGQGQTLYDLVTLIELATGRAAKATYAASQTGEVTRYVADISKAKSLLGYYPQTPLTKGIQQYIAWCRETGFLA
ncbi:MAG TPA: NAD-dependent epimerase/dehydratase family protein, partial [Chthoniobacteraceae bacterium]|nr:NAD-dependent epimerase/dehydratase family protein [Chthoniobacteraceae bacterium]